MNFIKFLSTSVILLSIFSSIVLSMQDDTEEPKYTANQLKDPTLQGFFQSQQTKPSESDEEREFDLQTLSFEPYKKKLPKAQKEREKIPQGLAKPTLFERLTFQTPAEDIDVHPWKQKGYTSQSPQTKLPKLNLFKGKDQDIVTYAGIKMLRRDAKSSWIAYQNESRKIREEEEKKKINQRHEKYQEEKKNIDYERATYKGFSLNELRSNKNDLGRLYGNRADYPALEDLDPWTVKELKDADRINPDRQRERDILEQQRQQAANKRQEELEREQAEREEYEKNQPGYWKGSLPGDDADDQYRFNSHGRREKAGEFYRGVPLDMWSPFKLG